jgi:hypothetical protein
MAGVVTRPASVLMHITLVNTETFIASDCMPNGMGRPLLLQQDMR